MKGRKFKWQGWRNFRVQVHSSQLQKSGTKGPKIKWMGERNFRVHLSHWCTSCTCSKSNSDRHDNPWNLNSKPLTWGLVYSTHSGRFWYDELLSVLWVYHIVSLWCCKTMFCFECHVIWHTIPGKPNMFQPTHFSAQRAVSNLKTVWFLPFSLQCSGDHVWEQCAISGTCSALPLHWTKPWVQFGRSNWSSQETRHQKKSKVTTALPFGLQEMLHAP